PRPGRQRLATSATAAPGGLFPALAGYSGGAVSSPALAPHRPFHQRRNRLAPGARPVPGGGPPGPAVAADGAGRPARRTAPRPAGQRAVVAVGGYPSTDKGD